VELILMLKAHRPLLYERLRQQVSCRANHPQRRSPGRSRDGTSPR
jgi:hypothetical protein